jgi:hypothetical protein
MAYRILFVFVEGVDDKRFIEKVISPFIQEKGNYSLIKPIEYAVKSSQEFRKFIQTISHQPNQNYILLCDMDSNGDKNATVKNRVEKIIEKYGQVLDADKIIVVKEEIESWYYAGITNTKLEELGLPILTNTEALTKEEFERMIPKTFISPNDFMVEILKEYVLKEGQERNNSLNYFIGKLETDY